MSVKTCNFVLRYGVRKGQICGKACHAPEGEELRCHKHKEFYVISAKQKMKAKYDNGLYITKDKRISELEDLTKQQSNQIGMLTEDLHQTQTKVSEQKKTIDVLTKEISLQQKETESQRKELATINKQLEVHKLAEKKEIGLLKLTNDTFAKKLKEIELCKDEYKRHYEAILIERDQLFQEKKRNEIDNQLRYHKLKDNCKKALIEVFNRVAILEKQFKELTAYSIQKTTKDQIKRNTVNIESVMKYIDEQKNSWF